MSIPMKNKNGDIFHISMAINCADHVHSLSDDDFVNKEFFYTDSDWTLDDMSG